MFDKVFETFRKAAESSLRAQQDLLRQWAQPWPFVPPGNIGMAGEWNEAAQRRWLESATGALNNHREFLNSMYKSAIQVLEQAFRAGDVKTPEDYRRVFDDVWSKLSENFREQTEAQMREFQKAAELWSPPAQKAKT